MNLAPSYPPPFSGPPIKALELQTVAMAVGVGVWMSVAQSFEHSTGPIYRYMRAADELVWTGSLLFSALLWLAGTVAPLLWLRKLGLIVIANVWALMAACFVAGNPYAFTTFTYFALALSAGFSSLRLHHRPRL